MHDTRTAEKRHQTGRGKASSNVNFCAQEKEGALLLLTGLTLM
jgi:hypothetical protein